MTHRMWTASGRTVDLQCLRTGDILLEDIAHALSHQCRFAGHTSAFYSVAQHSVLVSLLCPRSNALWGLLHDASEAYLSDIVRPVKDLELLVGYRRLECRVMESVCARFGLPLSMPASVLRADDEAGLLEQRSLFPWLKLIGPRLPMDPWSSKHARALFLARYQELTSELAVASAEQRS